LRVSASAVAIQNADNRVKGSHPIDINKTGPVRVLMYFFSQRRRVRKEKQMIFCW
jgi:hypothetical protein